MFVRECQKDGIWAWDCETNEPVLLIPCVLALLGDNPMQSEFAAHIGMRGKYFCRACWVKGSDAADGGHAADAGQSEDGRSDGGSDGGSDQLADDAVSDRGGQGQKSKKRRRKVVETMTVMISRVKAFVNVSLIHYSPLLHYLKLITL